MENIEDEPRRVLTFSTLDRKVIKIAISLSHTKKNILSLQTGIWDVLPKIVDNCKLIRIGVEISIGECRKYLESDSSKSLQEGNLIFFTF